MGGCGTGVRGRGGGGCDTEAGEEGEGGEGERVVKNVVVGVYSTFIFGWDFMAVEIVRVHIDYLRRMATVFRFWVNIDQSTGHSVPKVHYQMYGKGFDFMYW